MDTNMVWAAVFLFTALCAGVTVLTSVGHYQPREIAGGALMALAGIGLLWVDAAKGNLIMGWMLLGVGGAWCALSMLQFGLQAKRRWNARGMFHPL